MKQLEELYKIASEHLEGKKPDWSAFADQFSKVYNSGLFLYQVQVDDVGWVEGTLTSYATTIERAAEMYMGLGLHRQPQVKESELTSLEPSRRSDMVSNEQFKQMSPVYELFSSHGIFYFMVVPAVLDNGNHLNLMVWRDEAAGDFDDIEKMRLGLFMRYLLKIVNVDEPIHNSENEELTKFGKRYGLTKTEVEILSYLIEGFSLKMIAGETGRTYGTVRWHVRNLLEKCHVNSQNDLLRQFYQLIKK